jgi:hypothetical protein
MGPRGTLRAIQVAERRQQREAQKRLRELERQAKEQAKLSAIEQARLEVETFDNQLEVLLSVHKEQGEAWDWVALAASLPPPCPQRHSYHEQRANQRLVVLPARQRQSEAFQPVIPLTPEDITQTSIEDMGFDRLLANIQKMRGELNSRIAELGHCANDSILQTSLSP